jgi:hypothetical protein
MERGIKGRKNGSIELQRNGRWGFDRGSDGSLGAVGWARPASGCRVRAGARLGLAFTRPVGAVGCWGSGWRPGAGRPGV